MTSDRVQPASYDCGLGNEFIVFDSHSHVQTADRPARRSRTTARATTTADQRGPVRPASLVSSFLRRLRRRVKIPETLVARIEGKSSIGRLGIMVHVTAGYIDPGFCGQVTLEMTNLRNLPIILRVGKPICQLSFHLMESTSRPSPTVKAATRTPEGVEASLYGKQRVRAGTASHVMTPDEAAQPFDLSGIAPFTPMHEAFTCVPHGIYPCPTCLAGSTPRASDPEVT
jgi:dCTP deaminase